MASKARKEIMSLMIGALIILFIAGFAAFLLTAMLGNFAMGAVGQGVLLIIVAIVMVLLRPMTKIDNMSVFNVIVLFLMLIGLGTIIGTFVPAIAPFLLVVGEFTASGLGFVFLYIQVAEIIRKRIGL